MSFKGRQCVYHVLKVAFETFNVLMYFIVFFYYINAMTCLSSVTKWVEQFLQCVNWLRMRYSNRTSERGYVSTATNKTFCIPPQTLPNGTYVFRRCHAGQMFGHYTEI